MTIFSKQIPDKLNKTQLSLRLLLIISPWIVLFCTTCIIAHQSVFHSVPCWSDELAYWHEILSFSQKGFDFGYYTINETVPACFSFGTHGFGTVSIYALFGKIFGWKTYSIVIANSVFVSLAFLIILSIVKISTKKILLILFFSLTYPPLLLFSSTSMSELLNFSVLIIYFSLLHEYFKYEKKKWLLFLLIFCTAISFIRIIYIVLYLPLFFKRINKFRFDFKLLLYFVLWLVISGILFLLNNLFVSPYPGSFLNELFISKGFPEFVRIFATHFIENTWNFINPFSENIIQVLQRYFLISVLLICLVKSTIFQSKFKKMDVDYFIVFFILILFLLITIGAYDVFDWRDYRVLAPVLFGCILYLILNNKRPAIYCAIAFNIIGILILLFSPQIIKSFNKGRYTEPLGNSILNHIEYTAHPVSRFENTIVVQQFNTNVVLNIPAGIGIGNSDEFSDKLKSRYIYSDKKLKLKTYKLVDSNKYGVLYRKIEEH